MNGAEACPFCQRIAQDDVTHQSEHAVAFPDAYPIAPGHTLICPRPHVESVFELHDAQWTGLWLLVRAVQRTSSSTQAADGWNIGVNSGGAAGQTVEHAHVHLIPRTIGDVPDPRGGVRWIVPDRADYWTRP